MARKLIDQEEAARMLGITPEQVSVLRDRKKLFPYRDGDQWKFKQEDIERYREEMKEEKGEAGGGGDEAEAPIWDSGAGDDLENIDLQVNDEIDSILLSEVEMGKSSTEGASTIIGKPGEDMAEDLDLPPVSGINIADAKTIGAKADAPKAEEPQTHDADVLIPLDDDTDVLAAGGSMVRKTESGLRSPGGSSVVGDSKNVLSGNSGMLQQGSTSTRDAGSSGLDLVGDSTLARFGDVKFVPSEDDKDKKSGGSSDKLFGSDALQLSDDELKLMEVGPPANAQPKPAEGSKKGSGSSIKLGDEELELVMGSKSGSDLTQSPSDSGIQLISASDSGLSLDQPLALGSSAKRLLDMPSDELGSIEEIADEAPTELKTDEDFLLTAVDDTGEESSDSGSQVIALDTDDEMSSGMFAAPASGAGLLEDEPSMTGLGVSSALGGGSAASFGASGGLMGGGLMGEAAVAPSRRSDSSYSGANIALLAICTVLLMFCGMMMFDLMRNMWSWEGPYPVNSSIMDSIGKLGLFDK